MGRSRYSSSRPTVAALGKVLGPEENGKSPRPLNKTPPHPERERKQEPGPWTLFSVDEELEDEDFLSALEDAENRLAGELPGPAGHLHPTVPLEASRPPAPHVPSTVGDPRRPLLTSSDWRGGQRPVWAEAAPEGPGQDKLDQVLADLELELGAGAEDPTQTKRARVQGPSGWSQLPLDVPPKPAGSCRTPRTLLRPGATWAAAAPPGHTPQPRQPTQPPLPLHGPEVSLGAPPPSRAPACPAVSPISTLRGPRSSLHMPVVTNHLVQLVTAGAQSPARVCRRRFPGPAGLLPQQHGKKNPEEIMVSAPQTPAHGALAKRCSKALATSAQASAEEDVGHRAWLAMKAALRLDDGDPTCFLHTCSVAMVLRKAALRQLPGNKVPTMAVMIKSLTRSTMDASAVLRDPTGEMQGTLHRALLEARQGELKPGAVLLLRQVGVFSPSLRNHYLNVTPSNLVRVYSPDSGDGGLLRPPQPTLEVRDEGALSPGPPVSGLALGPSGLWAMWSSFGDSSLPGSGRSQREGSVLSLPGGAAPGTGAAVSSPSLSPQHPGGSQGRPQPDVAAQPGPGLRTRQGPGARVALEEDALDGEDPSQEGPPHTGSLVRRLLPGAAARPAAQLQGVAATVADSGTLTCPGRGTLLGAA
ncbi:hypothetical protein H920_13349 [Fukomys damarensis]|uniref:Homologous recombination OB-fold protein OB-fold domain-containing protein n=1 Tax=Fukomys damarensis TaxID=885580 RepID=A0A091CZL4_FUKDA|nr:hypothetical protein H920_13349 [Fukomys damarensis]